MCESLYSFSKSVTGRFWNGSYRTESERALSRFYVGIIVELTSSGSSRHTVETGPEYWVPVPDLCRFFGDTVWGPARARAADSIYFLCFFSKDEPWIQWIIILYDPHFLGLFVNLCGVILNLHASDPLAPRSPPGHLPLPGPCIKGSDWWAWWLVWRAVVVIFNTVP